MYVIHPPDEFRKAVEGLRFNYDELESIPTNIKRWRVPQMLLKQHPIFFPLMQQYNKEGLHGKERARGRNRKLVLKRGPDFLLLGSGHSTLQNEVFVGIVVPTPSDLPNGTSGAPEHVSKPVETSSSNEALPSTSDNEAPDASPSDAQQQHIPPRNDPLRETLKAKVEFVIKNAAGADFHAPPSLDVGDILEIRDLEKIEVKNGGLALIGMAYDEEELGEGS